MGDRGNVYVIDPYANVVDPCGDSTMGTYLYTHWGGSELPETLAEALDSPAGRGRWSDGAYLTRIIFCSMVAHDVLGETGYGISCHLADNEHPILVVDPKEQRVYLVPDGAERKSDLSSYANWSFDEYIATHRSSG